MPYRLITPPPRKPEHIAPRSLQRPPKEGPKAQPPKPPKTPLERPPEPPKPPKAEAKKPKKAKKSRGLLWGLVVLILIGVLIVGSMSYLQAPPKTQPQAQRLKLPSAPASSVNLPWPKYGQSAIGAQGYGVLETSGSGAPTPIASVAKVITALSVLSKKPLAAGQQGPTIALTQADVDSYNDYFSRNGSVAAVAAGEKITEYQALEALMLPSADNMADTLARWSFGSMENYVAYANGYVKKLGLNRTAIADASGFSAKTTSTARDLVLLGIEAIKNPALASVVNEQLANLPVAGTIYNLNFLLGQDGVIGIKTGNTDEAGGCFLFAAKRSLNGRAITTVGVVMGAPNYTQAIKDSQPLITASDKGFELRKVVPAGRIAGTYSAPWGTKAVAAAQKDMFALVWKDANPSTKVNLESINAPASKGQRVGTISVESGGRTNTVPLVLTGDVKSPSVFWRIFH